MSHRRKFLRRCRSFTTFNKLVCSARILKIPSGFEVRSITGYSNSKQVSAAQVNEYRKSDIDESLWSVDFSRKALGKIGLLVEIEKELFRSQFVDTNGRRHRSLICLFPQVSDAYIEYSSGSTIVYGPVSLRINPETVTGLQQATAAKAVEKIAARGSQSQASQAVLSYTFSGTPLSFDQCFTPQTANHRRDN